MEDRPSIDGTTAAPVVLVTGPAGAGKTALADAYARTRPERSLHLSLDDARDRVRAGYANPEDGWNDVTQRQYDLARRSCALAARLYAADGYTCVIDDLTLSEAVERLHRALTSPAASSVPLVRAADPTSQW